MPIAKIQLPDGRIGRFEVPEGTTPEQVMSFVQSGMGGQNQPSGNPGKLGDSGATWGGVQQFAGGLVQGLGDEIMAATAAAKESLGGGLPFGNAYGQAKTAYQAQRGKYEQEKPKTAAALDVAGQAAPWLAAAPLMPMGAPTLAGRVGQSALTGAGVGGVSGFTNAEGDFTERAKGAGRGAVLGAATGAVAQPVVEGVAWGTNKAVGTIADKLRGVSAADRKVASVLSDIGGGDLDAGIAEASKRLAESGPDTALADVLGIGGQRMGRAVANVPGQSSQMADDFIAARMGGRGARMKEPGGLLGPADDVTGRIEALKAQRGAMADDLYSQAFKANPSMASKEIDKILETPAGSAALRKAAQLMQNDRTLLAVSDPEMTAALREAVELGKMPESAITGHGVASGLKLRTLDYVKRAMGDMEGAALRQGNNTEASILGNLRRSLVKEMDALDVTGRAGPNSFKPEGGLYAQGRAQFAQQSRIMDALENGKGFMKSEPGEISRSLAKMSPQEAAAFRMGARNALDEFISRDTQAISRFADKKEVLWSKIRALFPDDATFNQYRGQIQNELSKAQTERFVSPRAGSQTAPLGQDIAELNRVPQPVMDAIGNFVQGRYMQAAGGLLRAPFDRMTAPSQEAASGLAGILFEMQPTAQQSVLRRIGSKPQLRVMPNSAVTPMARALMMSSIPGESAAVAR